MKHKNLLYTGFYLFMLALFSGCTSAPDQQAKAIPLFPDKHGFDLKQVSISGSDTTLDFKRVDCVWVVGDDNKQSDEPRVTILADKLVTMAPDDLAAIAPERYNEFLVGDDKYSRKVTLTFKDKSSYTLLIGTPAITKPTYVRLAGKELVYKVDEPLIKQISLDLSSWLAPADS